MVYDLDAPVYHGNVASVLRFSKFVNSFDLQRLGVRGWGWFTVLGILMAVAGFFSFWDPFIGAMAMAAIIGIILILQGIASIMKGCFANRYWM